MRAVRLRPRVADTLLAAVAGTADLLALTLFGGSGDGRVVAALLSLGAAGALLLRRDHPLIAAAAAAAAEVASNALVSGYADRSGPSAATIVALYSVGAYRPARLAWPAAVACSTAFAASALGRDFSLAAAFVEGARSVVIVGVGQFVRGQRELQASRQNDATAGAVRAERRRIARELHDIVAHHISAMGILTGAARATLRHDPDEANEALTAAERTGRDALREMRHLLNVLRADDLPDDAAPPPPAGVADLPALLDRVRDAGLRVDHQVVGVSRPLTAAVDLAVYRIVQEALTNVRKHAGPARAEVQVRYEDDGVVVEVTDTGETIPARAGITPGHGILGMAERATLIGGQFRAGPARPHGFTVHASLPTGHPSHAAATPEDTRGD